MEYFPFNAECIWGNNFVLIRGIPLHESISYRISNIVNNLLFDFVGCKSVFLNFLNCNIRLKCFFLLLMFVAPLKMSRSA